MLVRHGAEQGHDAVQRRQQHLLAGGLQHQAVAGVVDVLAGAGEVHELSLGGQFRQVGRLGELLLDPVLDRLHIVIRGALDVLDGLRLGRAEARQQLVQVLARRVRKRRKFRQAGVRQRNEPFDLHLHAAVDQPELREQASSPLMRPA